MGRNNEYLRRYASVGVRPVLRLVLLIFDMSDASIRVDYHLGCHGPIQNLNISGLESLVERNAGIVLRLDRADRNAIGVTGADPPGLIWLRIATCRRTGDDQLDAVHRQTGDRRAHRAIYERRG